jgi:hypothetical protein
MQNLKKYLALFLVLITAMLTAQYTDQINSNRPGESQGAFSVGKSIFQIEGGLTALKEKHNLLFTDTAGVNSNLNFRYGLFFEQLEFNLELIYQMDQFTTNLGQENRNNLKKTVVGAKYLIFDPYKNRDNKPNLYSWKANNRFKWSQFIPAVSLFAGANITFDSPYTFKNDAPFSPKIMLIAQNQFSSGYVLVTNIIADKFTTEFPSYGYIVTLTKGFSEKWSGFIENQGYMSDFYADSLLRGGAAVLIKNNIQIDASVSTNFKNTPSILYGGVGLSWRFEKNYKPTKLQVSKGGKSDKKTKSKKRKDEVQPTAAPTK